MNNNLLNNDSYKAVKKRIKYSINGHKNLVEALEKMLDFIENGKKNELENIRTAFENRFETLLISDKILFSTDFNKENEINYDDFKYDLYNEKQILSYTEEINIEVKKNYIEVTLPLIITKSKYSKDLYIKSCIQKLIKENLNEIVKLVDKNIKKAVIFEYHIDENDNSIVPDADNLATKHIIDMFNGIVFNDDSLLNMSLFQYSLLDKKTYTKLYIVPEVETIKFLKKTSKKESLNSVKYP